MRLLSTQTLASLAIAAGVALSIVGCSKGDAGPAGANGSNGVNGVNGTNGANGTNGVNGTNGTNGANGTQGAMVRNAGAMSVDEWMNLAPQGSIQTCTISGGAITVNFTLTDPAGHGITGLENFTQKKAGTNPTTLPNFYFYLGKLVAATDKVPSRWYSYMVANPFTHEVGVAGSDVNGNLVGHGDGTYTYTFGTNLNTVASDVAAAGFDTTSALGNYTYDANAYTRIAIEFYGNARGTGTGRHANTSDGKDGDPAAEIIRALNLTKDFIPATGAAPGESAVSRAIVVTDTCNSCHAVLKYHGNHRLDAKTCVLCHNDQLRFGSTEAVRDTNDHTIFTGDTHQINGTAELDFPQLIHKLHAGESLQMTGYDFAPDGVNAVNEIRYPQSLANCATCHVTTAAAPEAGNWAMNPSRVACGACHDKVNFVTGENHGPSAAKELDDSHCAGCHNPSDQPPGSFIATYHTPVVPPNSTNAGLPTVGPAPRGYLGNSANSHTNASWVAGNQNILPTGAHTVQWDLQDVTATAGSTSIVWTFRIMKDGAAATINTFDAVNHPELIDGFAGGPNLYLAFAVPQDGITKPSDWNGSISVNLRKLWRGGSPGGSVVQDSASKVITATLTASTVPTNASMLTGGIGYFYGVVTQTQLYGDPGDATHTAKVADVVATLGDNIPLTQIDLPDPYAFGKLGATSAPLPYQGGLSVAVPNQFKVVTGQTARRSIVSTEKCQTCHENLGVFTDAVFHAGQRNNAETCTFCHNVNGVDAGWGYNIKEAVHSLHAASKRTVPYTWQAGGNYWGVTYPAQLASCESCHVPGSYDFSNDANAAQAPNMLWTQVAGGSVNLTTGAYTAGIYTGVTLTDPAAYVAGTAYISPFVVSGQNYGISLTTNTAKTPRTNVVWPYSPSVDANNVAITPTTITSVAAGAVVQPDPATLVNSPITSACYACHDTTTALAHMKTNGGYIATVRSKVVTVTATAGGGTVVTSPIPASEACMTCHGSGKIADVKTVHGATY